MQEYSRLVGIDVGKKRVGIAQTDLLKTIASPVGTWNPEEAISHLKTIVQQNKVERFVIGWPLEPDGTEGRSTAMVAAFIKKLEAVIPYVPISRIDERHTSVKAMQLMIEAGIPKKKRREKQRVDKIAAAVILQHYLDEYEY